MRSRLNVTQSKAVTITSNVADESAAAWIMTRNVEKASMSDVESYSRVALIPTAVTASQQAKLPAMPTLRNAPSSLFRPRTRQQRSENNVWTDAANAPANAIDVLSDQQGSKVRSAHQLTVERLASQWANATVSTTSSWSAMHT